jgi:hypothetical protein
MGVLNMKNENSTFPNILSALCSQCQKNYKTLRKHKNENCTHKVRQPITIINLHEKSCNELYSFMKGLSNNDKKEYGTLVEQILSMAESRAEYECPNASEQSFLYDILVNKAWVAASTYDVKREIPFQAWVHVSWLFAIREFWKAKRLQEISLTETISLEDIVLEDLTEIHEVIENVFGSECRPTGLDLISIAWAGNDLLCPYCRQSVMSLLIKLQLGHTLENSLDNNQAVAFDVYAKRDLWKILSSR